MNAAGHTDPHLRHAIVGAYRAHRARLEHLAQHDPEGLLRYSGDPGLLAELQPAPAPAAEPEVAT